MASEDSETLTENQKHWLFGLLSFFTAVYSAMIVLCVHNFCRYIYPTKMSHGQLWGFYALAISIYSACIVELIYCLVNGVGGYQIHHDFSHQDSLTVEMVTCMISDFLFKVLYLLITMTLYQLFLGIAFINGEIEQIEVVKGKSRVARILMLVACCFLLVFFALRITILKGIDTINASISADLAASSLIYLVYMVIYFKLKCVLRRLPSMEKERRQIKNLSLSVHFTFVCLIILLAVLLTLGLFDAYVEDFYVIVATATLAKVMKVFSPLLIMLAHAKNFQKELSLS